MAKRKLPLSRLQLLQSKRLSSPLPLKPLKPGWFEEVKAFFRYSKVIFIARSEAAVGFVAIVIGSLDWSPFFGLTGFDTHQIAYLGGLSLIKGVVTEWARKSA